MTASWRAGPGRLVLVATPIGNLGDLSKRALDVLRVADVIGCEDTRRTGRLLEHAGITGRRLLRVDEHSEAAATAEVLRALGDGALVALVTDAGTPAISDPGERLVRAAIDAGHLVTGVPGPTALVLALVLSGLPTSRFVFEGFLPRAGPARSARLAEVVSEHRTVVLYEAPHRVARTLADLAAAAGGDRAVAVARELTKLHEEVWRGTLDEAVERTAAAEPRGEHVLVLAGAPAPPPIPDDEIAAALRTQLRAGRTRRDAAALVAAALELPRNRVYELALRVEQ